MHLKEYVISPRSGMHLSLARGENIRIVDLEGRQVVDFFAMRAGNPHEILSPGVTIDCNGSLNVTTGDSLYSNLYAQMFSITEDTVGQHDLIHPCCRTEMYDLFYGNGKNHPNCHKNINRLIEMLGLPAHPIIRPFNVFMNTRVGEDGRIEVSAPLSKPNDFIQLRALMDLTVFLAACSVSESDCNGGACTPVKVTTGYDPGEPENP